MRLSDFTTSDKSRHESEFEIQGSKMQQGKTGETIREHRDSGKSYSLESMQAFGQVKLLWKVLPLFQVI